MCGIAGVLNLGTAEPVDPHRIGRMLATIRHRGPDQFGIYADEHVGLGNARLSIIDLAGGQQPIANEDESIWVVFNGEIFNYVELRSALETRGHRFSTNTDTEVLVHLYEEYGPDCLHQLNGQFAIALWNTRTRTLFLARDRVGIRPLFYTRVGHTLIFGSEIKALLADSRVTAEIDPVSLAQIFTFWSTLSPRTVFRGITEVPPGHYALVRDGDIRLYPYWSIAFPGHEAHASRSIDDDMEELQSLLVDATRLRMRADVPVGAYLSGGLDSSTTTAIARKYTNNRLDTFSIAFSDPQFDESSFQRRMASFLGTEHHVEFVKHEDIGRVFPDLIWHAETPTMRTAPAPMFLLSKLVRSHGLKVVLTGEGADEFLGGYDIFKEAAVRRFWARHPESTLRPLLLRRLYPDLALGSLNPGYLAAFFGHRLSDVDSPWYSHAVRWHNNRRTHRFFSSHVRAGLNGASDPPPLAWFPSDFMTWGPLQRSQYLEISIFMSQYLLSVQGDRPAMAHSVEGRFPFLDYRIMEFCNRLPAGRKLHGLTEKYLLKRLARELVPSDIWQRPKRPYRAPIHKSFFRNSGAGYIGDLLSPSRLKAAGLFNPDAAAQLIGKVQQGMPTGETDDMALAGIISTQLVYEQFVSGFRPAQGLSDRDDLKVCGTVDAARRIAR